MAVHAFHPRAGRAVRRRGYTLVELLLALSLLALISTAVSSALFGFSRGSADQQDLRQRNSSADVVCNRIDTAIRACGMLLACGEHSMVLWIADNRANGAPNLSELRRIEWDSPTGEIRCYSGNPALSAADDTAYTLADDFDAVTSALKGTVAMPAQPLAIGARGWTVAGRPSPQDARLVTYSVTLSDARGEYTVRSCVALRGVTGRGG